MVIIIGNAIKYTSIGSIVVQISYKEKYITFQISDTGIGIKGKESKIFKMYGQINEHNTNKDTGIGFRLALCKDLVEIMKGTITAKPNQVGASFYIRLPSPEEHETELGCKEEQEVCN